MKIVFLNILVLLILNSFSKSTYNDTIVTKLHGEGCGLIPNAAEVDYNINFLENLQKTDSNNILIYKHLAMQYYILWSREKDNTFKNKAIENNKMVLNHQKNKKYFKVSTINNLMVLYVRGDDCKNALFYYNQLSKKEKKSLVDLGTVEIVKETCIFKLE